MPSGKVYILTNPSMPDWVKIGYTDKNDINERLKSLNASTAIPLSFRVFASLSIENAKDVEQSIHRIIDAINPELRAIETSDAGKERVREFFQISPERAFIVLTEIALREKVKAELIKPTADEIVQEEKANTRRGRIKFRSINIPIGSELEFINDKEIKCIVVDENNTVKYNENNRSISNLATELLGYNANGNKYFLYENETLWDRRIRLENEEI